jgi:hypothetical protein
MLIYKMNSVVGKTFDISPTCEIYTGEGKGEYGLWCGERAEYFCSNAFLTNDFKFIKEKACCEKHFRTFYSLPKYNGYLLKKDEETGKWLEIEMTEKDIPIPSRSAEPEEILWAEKTGNNEMPTITEIE